MPPLRPDPPAHDLVDSELSMTAAERAPARCDVFMWSHRIVAEVAPPRTCL
jgi:hypothetical protein